MTEPKEHPNPEKLLMRLLLWLNGDQFGAIIRPYGEEKIVMVLDYERTIKQIKAMWPRPHPAPAHKCGGYDGNCECDQCKHDLAIEQASRKDELSNLQDWRELELSLVPFDPWVFVNRENKHLVHLLQSLRQRKEQP
jgi:hypothetical protein